VPLTSSGVPLDQLFAGELLAGGYRKKYSRAVSRLVALSREADAR
jgi:cell division protein ZapE